MGKDAHPRALALCQVDLRQEHPAAGNRQLAEAVRMVPRHGGGQHRPGLADADLAHQRGIGQHLFSRPRKNEETVGSGAN